MGETNPAFLAAVALGHEMDGDVLVATAPKGDAPVLLWVCAACGWRAINYGEQVYGTAVEGACVSAPRGAGEPDERETEGEGR